MGVTVKENLFTFGGKSTKDFDIYLSGAGTYRSPERDVEMLTVPGRSGDLTFDNKRFLNVELSYKCLIMGNIDQNYEAFRAYMASVHGYQRLEDNFHPDEFRLAVFKNAIEPKIEGSKYDVASFEIVFNCKPQRWLKSGEEVIALTNSGMIMNNLLFAARPLCRVYAAGVLTIGDYSMTISNVDGYTDIDCDIMNAYKGSVNKNSTISGEFPLIEPGENEVSFTGGRVDITPRWYTI